MNVNCSGHLSFLLGQTFCHRVRRSSAPSLHFVLLRLPFLVHAHSSLSWVSPAWYPNPGSSSRIEQQRGIFSPQIQPPKAGELQAYYSASRNCESTNWTSGLRSYFLGGNGSTENSRLHSTTRREAGGGEKGSRATVFSPGRRIFYHRQRFSSKTFASLCARCTTPPPETLWWSRSNERGTIFCHSVRSRQWRLWFSPVELRLA